MPQLRVIVLDVGWGDAILLETMDNNGKWHFAVVDSNDTAKNQFSLNFLKRRLQTLGIDYSTDTHFLDFVLLTHAHADHGQGLKAIMQLFGTKQFWYSKSSSWSGTTSLLKFAQNPRQGSIEHHQAIDDGCQLPFFGDVELDILWPPQTQTNPDANENNNSVVMTLTLGDTTVLLSGDAEEAVWQHVASKIPENTAFVKVPHHGSVNGSLDAADNPTWLNDCPANAKLGISCHVGRYGHPHQKVLDLFTNNNFQYIRTDKQYHIEFIIDEQGSHARYHQES